MKNIFKIFLADARRISKNVVAVVVVMGLSVIPSLYAWFNIFSNWDPYGPDATSNLKVAVISLDKGTDVSGMELNVGDTVIEGLKSNNTIGWVFEESEEAAVEGVNSGEYYAALVIPEDFSTDMVSFLGGEIEHPEITYYENEKKNAIAPKITGKAKTAVQEQVNSAFVSTLAEGALKASNVLAGVDEGEATAVGTVAGKLTELRDNLQVYASLMNSFVGITNSTAGILSTTQAIIPNLNSMVESGRNTITSMQDMTLNGSGNADALVDMVSMSLDLIDGALEEMKNTVGNSLTSLGNDGAVTISPNLEGMEALLPYLREMFQNSVSGWTDEATNAQIAEINASLERIEQDISQAAQSGGDVSDTVQQLQQQLLSELEACQNQLKALKDTFNYSVKPSLKNTMNSMQGSLIDVQSLLGSIDGDFGEVTEVLTRYETTLNNGTKGLEESKAATEEMIQKLDTIIGELNSIEQDEAYQELREMLKTDPQLLAGFVSSPVQLNTEEIYPIENYGSAMTPFYTILALWVGALILVAIIHVKVHPEEGITNVKPYQQYFGRYIIFFLIGQVQTLITVLGEIFYIKIQCHNPFLFWLAAAVSSLVFTLFMYSLTVAFGNVGEALAVVIMVIQVAGAGGTFPIETLPEIYQQIYKYLPFPYGMNAMRETIGGMYGSDYLNYLGSMGIYIVISLFIGLVVAIPFRRFNEIVEKSKEKSDVMI